MCIYLLVSYKSRAFHTTDKLPPEDYKATVSKISGKYKLLIFK
ncbi:hypothetical protein HMPREF1553_01250 [Porphyromonas gingivalis F0568]|nr:hypothetical protein HMPREF1553_01250 [Porphyromonas gingivalis F0568]